MDNYAQFLQEQAAVNQMYAEMRAPQPITPYQSPNVTVISGETNRWSLLTGHTSPTTFRAKASEEKEHKNHP